MLTSSAFIAASRRKDRSLDARLESASRASMLHKRRTGRALAVDRETVASELMYEEIDDTYRAKMQRYLRLQSAQLNQDFDNSLLSTFAGPVHGLHLQMPPGLQLSMQSPQSPQSPTCTSPDQPSRPVAHHRPSSWRANNPANRPANRPIHAARNMSIDMSPLRNALPSPGTDSPTEASFSPFMSPDQVHAQAHCHAQVPPCVAASTPYPQHLPAWESLFGNSVSAPAPGFPNWPSGPEAGDMTTWKYRDRIASAPAIPAPVQAQLATTPAPARGPAQHARVKSEPGPACPPSSMPLYYQVTPSLSDSSSGSELLPTPRSATPLTRTPSISPPTIPNPPETSVSSNMNIKTDPFCESDIFKHTPLELQGFDLGFGLDFEGLDDQEYFEFSQLASTIDKRHAGSTQGMTPVVPVEAIGAGAGGRGDGSEMEFAA